MGIFQPKGLEKLDAVSSPTPQPLLEGSIIFWVQIAQHAQRTLGGGGGSSKAPPAKSGGGGGLAMLLGGT